MARAAVDRLTPPDLAVLWPQDLGWPQDIGLLAILDGAIPTVELLREHVAGRVSALPARFRRLLVRPRWPLGPPYWIDASEVDLEYHVRRKRLQGGGEDELLVLCEALQRRRFDNARPLWRLTLIDGLQGGRAALLMHVHHSIVDGVAGVSALAAFVDGRVPSHPLQSLPASAPTTTDLLVDVIARFVARLRRVLFGLMHPGHWSMAVARDLAAIRGNLSGPATATTSLNARIGSRRQYAVVRGQLETYKAIGSAHQATVNDVLLATLSAGLRAVLAARGECPDRTTLRVVVPVALRGGPDTSPQGNSAGGVLLLQPVGESDPVNRLHAIARDSADRKATAVMRGANSAAFSAIWMQRMLLRLAARQRLASTYAANVPGPPMELSIAGGRIAELFPLVPLLGNVTVGVGALSHAGQFNVTVVADGAVPDLGVLVAAMERDLKALAIASGVPVRFSGRCYAGTGRSALSAAWAAARRATGTRNGEHDT